MTRKSPDIYGSRRKRYEAMQKLLGLGADTMPGIRGRTADGAEMYQCLICGGQVYAKLLYVGPAGRVNGVITAYCQDCNASGMVNFPAPESFPAEVDERLYLEALAAMKRPEGEKQP